AIATLPKTDRHQQHSFTYIATSSDRLIRAQFPNTQSVDFGEANGVVSMAAISGFTLYAATNDNKLWRRDALRKDVSWDLIGHANEVVAMGAIGFGYGWLLVATNDGKIWMRDNQPSDMNWVPINELGVNNVKAMTAVSVIHWSSAGLPRVPVFIRGVAETHIVGEVYIVLANNELWIAEVPEPPWNFLARGRMRTEDEGDLIECTIDPDAVSRDVVEFV